MLKTILPLLFATLFSCSSDSTTEVTDEQMYFPPNDEMQLGQQNPFQNWDGIKKLFCHFWNIWKKKTPNRLLF